MRIGSLPITTTRAGALRPRPLPPRGATRADHASAAEPFRVEEIGGSSRAATGDVVAVFGEFAPFTAQQLAEQWPAELPALAQLNRGLAAYRERGAIGRGRLLGASA
jgi:hypothetical protein